MQRLLIIAVITLFLIHPVAFADEAAHDDEGGPDESSADSGDDSAGDSSSDADSGDTGSDDASDDSSSDGSGDDSADDSSSGDASSGDDSEAEPEAPPTTTAPLTTTAPPVTTAPPTTVPPTTPPPTTLPPTTVPPTTAPPTTQPPTTAPPVTTAPPTTVPPTTIPPTTIPPTTQPPVTTLPPTTVPPTTTAPPSECDIPEPTDDVTITAALGGYPSGGIEEADDKINTVDAKSANFDIRCDKYYVIVEKYDEGGYGVAYIDDDTVFNTDNTDDTGNMPMHKFLETGDKIKLSGTHFKLCIDPAGGSMVLQENVLDACSFGDTTAPQITVISPEPTTYDTTTITLSATADEPVTWTYSLDGGNSTSFTPEITITAEEGPHTITFTATDTSGNTATESVDFTVLLPDTEPPVVTPISPLESTGDNDGNITFVYSVTDTLPIASCSLFVNEIVIQTDTSIERNTPQEFATSLDFQGYNWAVECTDTSGNTGTSGLQVLTGVLISDFGGDTTDLSGVNTSNVTNFTIHLPEVGKIVFSEPIDLSEGADVNAFVKVSHNKIEIDSEALPVLNKPAVLYIYNLTFKNPIILRNGEPCPSSICEKISYEDGTFIFSVTQFSTYETGEEAPSTPPPAAGGGGGGGGSEESHSLEIDDLEVSNAKAGKTAVLTVTIENNGCCTEKAKLWVPSLPSGWEAEEKDVEIPAGTSVIKLKLKIPASEVAGTKKITVELVPEDFTPPILKDLLIDVSEVYKIFQIYTEPSPSPIPPLKAQLIVEPMATVQPAPECSVLPYLLIIILLLIIIALLTFLIFVRRKRKEEEKPVVETPPEEGQSGAVA